MIISRSRDSKNYKHSTIFRPFLLQRCTDASYVFELQTVGAIPLVVEVMRSSKSQNTGLSGKRIRDTWCFPTYPSVLRTGMHASVKHYKLQIRRAIIVVLRVPEIRLKSLKTKPTCPYYCRMYPVHVIHSISMIDKAKGARTAFLLDPLSLPPPAEDFVTQFCDSVIYVN